MSTVTNIQYTPSESPFFKENQEICKRVENDFKDINASIIGNCSSYGYDLLVKFKKENADYELKFIKSQTSPSSTSWIPGNTTVYTGLNLKATGLSKTQTIKLGRSNLKRFFMNKNHKVLIPKPYYLQLSTNLNNSTVGELIKLINKHRVSDLSLDEGELKCVLHYPDADSMGIVKDLEKIIQSV